MIAISASGTMASLKVLAFCCGPMEIGIRATSKKGLKMERDFRSIVQVTSIVELFQRVKNVDTANTFGKTAHITKALFQMVCAREVEFGNHPKVILIKANTKTAKNKDTEYIHGPTAQSTKATSDKILDKATVRCYGQTAVFTKVDGNKINKRVLDRFTRMSMGSKNVDYPIIQLWKLSMRNINLKKKEEL